MTHRSPRQSSWRSLWAEALSLRGQLTLLGGQEVFPFVSQVQKEIDAILKIPMYSWDKKDRLFCMRNGIRRKVQFPNPHTIVSYDAPIRCGEISLVCAGPDEGSRSVYQLDGLFAREIRKVGLYQVYAEMDPKKVCNFTPQDSLASWYPKGSSSVILDTTTGTMTEFDGIVDIVHFSRKKNSPLDRILVVRQTGLYQSAIPRSDIPDIYLWNASGLRKIEGIVPWIFQWNGTPYSLSSGRDTIPCVVSVLPGSKDDATGIAFDGSTFALQKEAGTYLLKEAPISP